MLIDRITDLCTQRGISIRQLEIAIGIGNGTIARWGSSSPKADNLKKVADYFGVTVDSFFESSDKTAKPA